jgi:hypothetical protein
MHNVCAESGQCIGGVVEAVIQKGIENGSFRPDVNPTEMSVILWAHCRGVMELIDHLSSVPPTTDLRRACGEIDFEKMYRKSTAMLVFAMLTDEARRNFKTEW